MSGWLSPPMLTGTRAFTCDGFTPEQCDYYMHHWHFWYIADYAFALPTIYFFLSVIAVFVIANFVSSIGLGYQRPRVPRIWQKFVAALRYLSYRGFHVKALRWNSAPLGTLLLGALGAIFFFCMDLIPRPYYWSSLDFGGSPPLATRSGWLALGCMPFVFATASKANWITLVTGVSHENLQVFHRWIAYAFFLLSLMHTFPFIVYHIRFHDMVMEFTTMSTVFYWTGIVALIFQAWLTFMSHSTIRKLGYEFFKIAHFTAVAVFVVVLFWHCNHELTSWHYFIATAAVYVPCLVFPWIRTCFEYGIRQKARISVEDNGFIRIAIHTRSRWSPGQHCFLRFTSFGIMQAASAHPFTICSTPSTRADVPSELVFYVRRQRGFTAKLYDLGLENPGATVAVLVDGPYGGANIQKFNESDHILMIAGGSGAGWCLPFIERFIKQDLLQAKERHDLVAEADMKEGFHHERTREHPISGPLSIRVILATRESSSRTWFIGAVEELLAKSSSSLTSSNFSIQIHVTNHAAGEADLAKTSAAAKVDCEGDAEKASEKASIFFGNELGRPQLPLIIREEAAMAAQAGRSIGVFVCGPITMQNDVRNAVAEVNVDIMKGSKSSGAYLHCEHFSWA